MQHNKNKTLQLVFTLIFWVCFLLLPFVFFPYNRDRSAFESSRFIFSYIYSNVFLVAFYYLNSVIFIPKLLARKKILSYTFLILLFFLVYLFCFFLISKYVVDTPQFIAKHPNHPNHPNRPPRNVWLILFSFGPTFQFLIAYTFSSVSKIIANWFSAEETKEEITKQQLETELSLLRSQMNPHFLFNTLNSIYSLTLSNNPKASDAVMKLSRIMRYTLEEAQSEYVPLPEEIAFINSYIDLQKLRTTDKVRVVFETDNVVNDVKIPPLLLIPFIENAFKFGVSARQQTEINVSIHVVNGTLVFSCENNIVSNISMPEGTGTGIANVKRRLELLYKDAYQLDINNENGKFKVVLILKKL